MTKSVIELAIDGGLLLKTTNLELCPSYLTKLTAFAEAYHKQKLGEMVPAVYVRLLEGDIDWNDDCFSGSKDYVLFGYEAKTGYSELALYSHEQPPATASRQCPQQTLDSTPSGS